MRFWDSSAIVPLLLEERSSDAVRAAFRRDPELVVWWATQVECVSALTRHDREGVVSAAGMIEALGRLDDLAMAWREIEPGSRVKQLANRLLRTHPLRAAEALQLASAIVAAEDQPATLGLVTFDQRLADAATREGFAVSLPV